MTILLIIMTAILVVLTLAILINSPGRLPPLKDASGTIIPGSISEKVWVEIGGIRQGMFIRGENPNNPIVLYLHGGPGTPLLQFISYLEKSERLEKYFTVCYWDQRGAGMTYHKETPPSTMTVEQMVEDTREVTQYLKSRFNQDKIYLTGHSWGSYLGVKTLEKYPEDYLAYIGIGQVTNQTESERIAYAHMLNRAQELNDQDTIKKLSKYDPASPDFPSLPYLVNVRTAILNKYGIGHLHQGLTVRDILKSLFVFRGYTLSEKINWVRGADFSMQYLFPPLLKDNLFTTSPTFKVPFYILQGAHDYQVSQELAEKYLTSLEAPKKAFYKFPNSAHSPNMEEPESFVRIFRQISDLL